VSARPLGWRFAGTQDRAAEHNRARLNAAGVFAVNLIGQAGAGKSALVHRTVEALGRAARVGVVATARDRDRRDPALTVEIDHQSAPHLSPSMLSGALSCLGDESIDFLIIKNVADFVCPATYRLGTHANVRITTVLDHDERPHHQPQLFEGLDALVVNMIDRLAETAFDVERFRRGIDLLNPNLVVLPVSCTSEGGVDKWIEWLMRRRAMQFYPATRSSTPHR
jgi:hydrogenase nickel incorporation protein HypB